LIEEPGNDTRINEPCQYVRFMSFITYVTISFDGFAKSHFTRSFGIHEMLRSLPKLGLNSTC